MKRFLMHLLYGSIANIPWFVFVLLVFPNPALSRWYGAIAGGVGAIFGMLGGAWYEKHSTRARVSVNNR